MQTNLFYVYRIFLKLCHATVLVKFKITSRTHILFKLLNVVLSFSNYILFAVAKIKLFLYDEIADSVNR